MIMVTKHGHVGSTLFFTLLELDTHVVSTLYLHNIVFSINPVVSGCSWWYRQGKTCFPPPTPGVIDGFQLFIHTGFSVILSFTPSGIYFVGNRDWLLTGDDVIDLHVITTQNLG